MSEKTHEECIQIMKSWTDNQLDFEIGQAVAAMSDTSKEMESRENAMAAAYMFLKEKQERKSK